MFLPIRNTAGKPSWSTTLALGASLIVFAAFGASLFGFVKHPVTGSDCAVFVAPFLALVWGRRHTDAGKGDVQ
jgi:hypothetical protein